MDFVKIHGWGIVHVRVFLMNNVQLYTEESTLPELIMNATVTLFGEANNLNQNAKVQKYIILLIELSP